MSYATVNSIISELSGKVDKQGKKIARLKEQLAEAVRIAKVCQVGLSRQSRPYEFRISDTIDLLQAFIDQNTDLAKENQ